jgi:hypothetical protein
VYGDPSSTARHARPVGSLPRCTRLSRNLSSCRERSVIEESALAHPSGDGNADPTKFAAGATPRKGASMASSDATGGHQQHRGDRQPEERSRVSATGVRADKLPEHDRRERGARCRCQQRRGGRCSRSPTGVPPASTSEDRPGVGRLRSAFWHPAGRRGQQRRLGRQSIVNDGGDWAGSHKVPFIALSSLSVLVSRRVPCHHNDAPRPATVGPQAPDSRANSPGRYGPHQRDAYSCSDSHQRSTVGAGVAAMLSRRTATSGPTKSVGS